MPFYLRYNLHSPVHYKFCKPIYLLYMGCMEHDFMYKTACGTKQMTGLLTGATDLKSRASKYVSELLFLRLSSCCRALSNVQKSSLIKICSLCKCQVTPGRRIKI